MRVVVLGARGLIGHMLIREISSQHEVFGTSQHAMKAGDLLTRFIARDRLIVGVDAERLDSVRIALESNSPDVVINCIGITKQHALAADEQRSLRINKQFPRDLSALCRELKIRLVHLSTDCVFSGNDGNYRDDTVPDSVDIYGRTKAGGELCNGYDLTLRTSFVGRELQSATNLFEWAIAQRGSTVSGYTRAIYSGFTTRALARIINEVITRHQSLSGLWNVASEPISKHDLLGLLNAALDLQLNIITDDLYRCDRSLDGSRFSQHTGIDIPKWPTMIDDFASDQATYAGVGA